MSQEHLSGFIAAFVQPGRRERWTHALLERPDKARAVLLKFERHVDSRRCVALENRDDALAHVREDAVGLSFDGAGAPRFLTLRDAIDASCSDTSDAIFSIEPGRLAVFFHHEGWAWLCRHEPT